MGFNLITEKVEVLPEMNSLVRISHQLSSKNIFMYLAGAALVHPYWRHVNGNEMNQIPQELRITQTSHWFPDFRFDLESRTWTILKPMNVGRACSALTVLNGHICIAGGRGNNIIETVEIYDPSTDEWLQVASMNIPRISFALFKSSMFIYAIGCASTVERYNPLKNSWTKVCIHRKRKIFRQYCDFIWIVVSGESVQEICSHNELSGNQRRHIRYEEHRWIWENQFENKWRWFISVAVQIQICIELHGDACSMFELNTSISFKNWFWFIYF